jgi:hypothetical protein
VGELDLAAREHAAPGAVAVVVAVPSVTRGSMRGAALPPPVAAPWPSVPGRPMPIVPFISGVAICAGSPMTTGSAPAVSIASRSAIIAPAVSVPSNHSRMSWCVCRSGVAPARVRAAGTSPIAPRHVKRSGLAVLPS